LEEAIAPGRPPSTRCAVNRRAAFAPHVDSGEGHGQSTSLIVGLGDFSGGELAVERRVSDVRYAPLEFDGWRERHWTLPFKGERYSLVFFTPAAPRARRSADDAAAAVLAGRASFAYRPGSSDALAIVEVLGDGCYATPPPSLDFDFSPAGRTVLDGGAHVGAFTRYALDEGAKRVVAFEPEPSNAALFRENNPGAELVEAALVDGASGRATLVLGADQRGERNTWRHALDGLSHYVDATERVGVDAVSFDEALDGVDFVKLDVEGAEMAILAADREWRGVERLVFEWSFTKNPALAPFLGAVRRLEAAGFAVAYDGMGTWDAGPTWPGRTDALVFCARDV
jgi:FkbM family methyltransferase